MTKAEIVSGFLKYMMDTFSEPVVGGTIDNPQYRLTVFQQPQDVFQFFLKGKFKKYDISCTYFTNKILKRNGVSFSMISSLNSFLLFKGIFLMYGRMNFHICLQSHKNHNVLNVGTFLTKLLKLVMIQCCD